MLEENIEILKKLRDLTKLSFRECQEALEKCNYNLQTALGMLEDRKLEFNSSNNERPFGSVWIKQDEGKIIAFVLKCQTDFVAFNENFQQTAKKIENILLTDFEKLKNQRELQQEAKIIKHLNLASSSLGENISLENCFFISKQEDEKVGIYIHHNKQIGSIVILKNGDEEIARELALQVVASKPRFLSINDIPVKFLLEKREKIITRVSQENKGKSSDIIEKIVEGMIRKHLSSICFLEQVDLRQPERKIKDYLIEKKAEVKSFHLISLI